MKRKRKKIFKALLIIFVILIIVFIIDLINARINSTDDISNLKRITIYDKNEDPIYTISNLHEASWIPIEELSSDITMVFTEIEDRRFYQHSGFDIYRIFQATFHNIANKDKIGASTITQQYVKNLYLNQNKSYLRKIKEIYYAIQLEQIYTKEEILEGYLNTIYFNHGIYGINDASYFYFNKKPNELTLAEIASLAAIIKSPTFYSPLENYNNNQKRKELILKTLLNRKKINQSTYDMAVYQKLNYVGKPVSNYSSIVLFYKDYVLNELYKVPNIPSKGHINIYTDFDSQVNDLITAYTKNIRINCNYSIVILNQYGRVISLVGGRDYQESTYNIATSASRMIGSTIKPLLYYEALEHGMTPLSSFTSEKCNFYIGNEVYTFQNYNNQYENQPITMAYALATSDNIYAMKTHLFLGSNILINRLNSFKVTDIENYPSLALGSIDMSLMKLTSIYHTFSTLGTYHDPYSIIRFSNDKNQTRYHRIEDSKKMLNSSSSFILTDLLTGVFDKNLSHKISVTGENIADDLTHRVAAKSGLTDFDSYFMAYNQLYTIGIWAGHNENNLLIDSNEKKLPKELFVQIFNKLMEDKEDSWYQKPNNVYSLFVDPTGFNTGYKKLIYLNK